MKQIKLTQGQTALIDKDKFMLISKYKWRALYDRKNDTYYARTQTKGSAKNRKDILMHRIIINAKKGELVDHINKDTLDNRKCNLRVCTYSQNNMNRCKKRKSKYNFKGVMYDSRYNKWYALIRYRGITENLGCFISEIEAAKAYDKEATKRFGEYAQLNFGITKGEK